MHRKGPREFGGKNGSHHTRSHSINRIYGLNEHLWRFEATGSKHEIFWRELQLLIVLCQYASRLLMLLD